MKKIKKKSFWKLPIAAHVAMHHNLSQLAAGARFSNADWTANALSYKAEFDIYDDVVRRRRASIWTAEIEEADAVRDSTQQQLFGLVDSSAHSSNPQEREAARKLQLGLRPYRGDTRSPYVSQTEQIRGILRFAGEGEGFEWLSTIKGVPIATRLQDENERFDELYIKRAEERQSIPTHGLSSKAQRRKVNTLWDALVEKTNDAAGAAAIGIDTGFDQVKLDAFIDSVNAIIEQYILVEASLGNTHKSDDEQITETADEMARLEDRLDTLSDRLEREKSAQAAAALAAAEGTVVDAARRRAQDTEALTARREGAAGCTACDDET